MTTEPPTHGLGAAHAQPGDGRTAPRSRFPVLEELPELADLLTDLVDADRAIARVVAQLGQLHTSGLVERATGLGLDDWIGLVARATGSDRRMLRTAADMLGSLPHLRAAFLEGAVSWAQLRTVLLQVRDARLPLDERLDTALAGAIGSSDGGDPDELARQVRWRLWDLAPDVAERQTVPGPERLVLQPRLDGTGGEVHGDLGPLSFAALDAATRPESDVAGPDRAARRAERLAELCLTGAPDDRSLPGADDVRRPAARVHLLLRAELETLLGDDGRPAQLLTSLAGGVMHVDASTAARLAGRAGSLRLVVTDHGAPVGIGRRSRHAPAWLRDAILALHDSCARPGCDRPASTADLDHAHRWSDGGPTDVANLAPLCAHHNRRRGGWHVSQQPDGTRHWRHALTGVHATSRPARPTRRAEPPDGERGRADPRPPPR